MCGAEKSAIIEQGETSGAEAGEATAMRVLIASILA